MTGRHRIFFAVILFSLPCFCGFAQVKDLDFYLEQGLHNSPLLHDLQNRVSSAAIDSLVVMARRKPQVEWKSQLLYSPYNDHLGYDEVITDGGNYQAVGYVSQSILNRRSVNNQLSSISIQRIGLGVDSKLGAAELKRTITDLYITAFSVYTDLSFNRSFLDLMAQENLLVERLVKEGVYSQSDLLALQVETDGQEILVRQLGNEYEKDVRFLNEACGLVDTASVVLARPGIRLIGPSANSGSLLLQPYLVDSLRIVNEKDALRLRYKPSVTWFADAGILTSNPWNFYRHAGASAGISLNFPIFDGKQKELEEKRLSFRENTRLFYVLNSRRQYDQQYLRLKGELEGLRDVRDRLNRQLELSGQLVKSLKSELEAGIVRMTDYLNALKSHRSINHSITLGDIAMMGIINEMNYLLSK